MDCCSMGVTQTELCSWVSFWEQLDRPDQWPVLDRGGAGLLMLNIQASLSLQVHSDWLTLLFTLLVIYPFRFLTHLYDDGSRMSHLQFQNSNIPFRKCLKAYQEIDCKHVTNLHILLLDFLHHSPHNTLSLLSYRTLWISLMITDSGKSFICWHPWP